MKISNKYPQFEKTVAWLLVCGTQEANFFMATNGEINNVAHFIVEKTKFSDREDMGRHGYLSFENGAKFEAVRRAERIDFLKMFMQEIKDILAEQSPDEVYLFAPETIIEELHQSMPAILRKKVRGTYAGNFLKKKPFDVLAKIGKKVLK